MSNNDVQYWYQRVVDQILISGLSERTADTYAREVRIFGNHISKSLEEVTEEDLREFILYRRNVSKLGGSSMRIMYRGLKILYIEVLSKKWPLLEIMKSQRESKLPFALSREDIKAILADAYTPQAMTFLRVVYSCGLRISEALNLTVDDIDWAHRRLLVHGKGSKQRYVTLPGKTYRYLRRYWLLHKNSKWIFPALGRNRKGGPTATKPMALSSVRGALRTAVKRAAIKKTKITMHTLRHSYATHLLDKGLSIKIVQENLGHATLQHTLVYLHLTNWGKENATLRIDQIMKEL